LLAVGALAGPAAGDPELDYGLPQHELSEIVLTGNETFSEDELEDILQISEPGFLRHPFSPQTYRPDLMETQIRLLRQFYRKRGFHEVAVSLDSIRTDEELGDLLYFGIVEGPRAYIDEVHFVGHEPFSDETLRDQIEHVVGKPAPADLNHLGGDIYAMRSLYWDEGYLHVRIDPAMTLEATADTAVISAAVEYRFDPGPQYSIGSIRVEGNRLTRDDLILRELRVRQGEVLSWRSVEQSRQQMLDTSLFRDVAIFPLFPDSTRALADLSIRVVERKPAFYELGAGVGSRERLRFLGAWGHNNLWGSGRRVTVRSKVTWNVEEILGHAVPLDDGEFNHRTDVFYTNPHLWGSRFSFDTNAYLKRETRGESGLNLTTHGFLVGTNWRGGLRVRNRAGVQLKESDPHLHPRAPDWLKTRFENARVTLTQTRSAYYTISVDERSDVFRPVGGQMFNSQAIIAGGPLGGDNSFVKWSGSWHRYERFLLGGVLALRIRLGAAGPYGGSSARGADGVPYDERFFAGGVSSVRGYLQNSLGPQILSQTELDSLEFSSDVPLPDYPARGGNFQLLTNAEWRFPLPVLSRWKLSSVVFVDGGNVWSNLEDIRVRGFRWRSYPLEFDDPTATKTWDYRYSVGTGLRLDTPFGPFRIDVGFPLKRARYEMPEWTRNAAESAADAAAEGDEPTIVITDDKVVYHFSLGYPF